MDRGNTSTSQMTRRGLLGLFALGAAAVAANKLLPPEAPPPPPSAHPECISPGFNDRAESPALRQARHLEGLWRQNQLERSPSFVAEVDRVMATRRIPTHTSRENGQRIRLAADEIARREGIRDRAQTRDLTHLGFMREGRSREAAIRDFQNFAGISATGVMNAATERALVSEALQKDMYVTAQAMRAAAQAGVAPEEVLKFISVESRGNTYAEAGTSTGAGLGQFLEQTWLEQFRRHGALVGLSALASEIRQNAEGRYEVRNAAIRASILDERYSPEVSIPLLIAYAAYVSPGGQFVDASTAYQGYVLGKNGADRLRQNPRADARRLAPRAAEANPSLFPPRARADQVLANIAARPNLDQHVRYAQRNLTLAAQVMRDLPDPRLTAAMPCETPGVVTASVSPNTFNRR